MPKLRNIAQSFRTNFPKFQKVAQKVKQTNLKNATSYTQLQASFVNVDDFGLFLTFSRDNGA